MARLQRIGLPGRRHGEEEELRLADIDLGKTLALYGDLAVNVGLNLQRGQRLLLIGPPSTGGVSLEAAPLVRQIVASAYRAGAPLVEVLWGDESTLSVRFKDAPRDSFGEVSSWLPNVLSAHAEAGHAVMSVSANDPNLLANEPSDLVGQLQQANSRSLGPFRQHITSNHTNWCVVAAASSKWAARVFPELPSEQQVDALWAAIIKLCRLDRPDPIQAWRDHIALLAGVRDYLNGKRYTELRYRGPGVDLSVGLPAGHLWVSARSLSRAGIPFTANLPTEEVFTLPHRDRVNGTMRASKPLSYAGSLIEGFELTFRDGRVTNLRADRGEVMLKTLVDTDAGASCLGELALVPHSSPISQSGRLFYNTLYDENAASHLALGSAYKFTLDGGEKMTDTEFTAAGGNRSVTHVDVMIGSGELDVDGITPRGTAEPIMRAGEWAFGE